MVDLSFAAHDDDGLDVWVCRAPSEHHVRRWAADAELVVDLLQPVDSDGHQPPMQDQPDGHEALEGDRS
jgi:hypothetical protein